MARSRAWFCLLASLFHWHCHAESGDAVLCIPQGLLLLEKDTRPVAASFDWPFCKEYQACSCCNVSHVATIQRSIGAENGVLTPCQTAISDAACRVCHPEVGVGLLETVCQDQCQSWYESCATDFFAFDPISARLILCKADSQLICSQLQYLATDGLAFCEQLGLKPSREEGEDCWFRNRPIETTLCATPPETALLTIESFKYVLLLSVLLLIVWALPYCGVQ